LFDSSCLIVNGVCQQPSCAQYGSQSQCNADKNCNYYIPLKAGDPAPYCAAAQCINKNTQTMCGGNKPGDICRWENGQCRQASPQELMAASIDQCVKEVDPDMWWLWFLLVLLLIVLGLIIWRMYLAYAKGLSFLDPPRKNVKFDAASRFAAELFEESKQTGEENNFFSELNGETPGASSYSPRDRGDAESAEPNIEDL